MIERFLLGRVNLIVTGVEPIDDITCDIERRIEINAGSFEKDSVISLGSIIDLYIILNRVIQLKLLLAKLVFGVTAKVSKIILGILLHLLEFLHICIIAGLGR